MDITEKHMGLFVLLESGDPAYIDEVDSDGDIELDTVWEDSESCEVRITRDCVSSGEVERVLDGERLRDVLQKLQRRHDETTFYLTCAANQSILSGLASALGGDA